MQNQMMCNCAVEYRITIGRPDRESYRRAKRILDRGKHPTFIGPTMVERNARNGGLLIFSHKGDDLAVVLMNARINSLLVLNVVPSHRSHGLGKAILSFCKPTWVRAIESAQGYFEKIGFTAVGEKKMGRALKTQVMVRADLPSLAGRVSRILKARSECVSSPQIQTYRDRVGMIAGGVMSQTLPDERHRSSDGTVLFGPSIELALSQAR